MNKKSQNNVAENLCIFKWIIKLQLLEENNFEKFELFLKILILGLFKEYVQKSDICPYVDNVCYITTSLEHDQCCHQKQNKIIVRK